MRASTIITSLFAFSLAPLALATNSPECFRFKTLNTPEASFLKKLDGRYLQDWCYQKRSVGGQNFVLIFNFDSEKLKHELTSLVRLNQKGEPEFMSAGFLSQGKVSIERLPDLDLNPYPAPLTLLGAMQSGKRITNKLSQVDGELDEIFNEHYFQASESSLQEIQEGEYAASVPEKNKPFNGFWWSHAGVPLASGQNSPLGIIDAYQQARGMSKSRAVAWEQANHSDTVVPWGGHCNGWAASSVLFPEPTKTLYDPLTHIVITPYAQKGMLAEASYCVNTAFYGNRYWGNHGDDLYDIHPDLFHKTLSYYIQNLGKTVALDYARDAEIDNHVISGYHFSISKLGDRQFHVNATLTVHGYDIIQEDSIGQAVPYTRHYSYVLNTDGQGKIIGGKWDATSDNPDFLWVALSSNPHCGGNNPNVDSDTVSKIISSLPEVQPRNLDLNLAFNQDLLPQWQIPIPFKEFTGDKIKIHYTLHSMSVPETTPTVYIVVEGNARYPITGGIKESVVVPLKVGVQTVTLDRLVGLNAFAIVNRDLAITNHLNLEINRIEYLGE